MQFKKVIFRISPTDIKSLHIQVSLFIVKWIYSYKNEWKDRKIEVYKDKWIYIERKRSIDRQTDKMVS